MYYRLVQGSNGRTNGHRGMSTLRCWTKPDRSAIDFVFVLVYIYSMLEFLNVKCVPCRDQLCCYEQAVRLWLLYLGCISSVSEAGSCTWNAFQLWRRLLYLGYILHFCDANADTRRQAVIWTACHPFVTQRGFILKSFSCLWRKCAMSGLLFFLFGKKMMTQAGCWIWHVFRSSVTQILTGTKAHSCFSGNIFWSFSWRGSGFRIKDQSQNKNTGICYSKC